MSSDHKVIAARHLARAAECAISLPIGSPDQMAYLATAQVHATLALVQATEKQTAAISLIIAAMQTGMDNYQRAEFDRGLTRYEAEE